MPNSNTAQTDAHLFEYFAKSSELSNQFARSVQASYGTEAVVVDVSAAATIQQ